MTPQEVGEVIAQVVERAKERAELAESRGYWTPGAPQRFETMSLDDLMAYVEEEILDIITYSVLTWIRFTRLREAADAAVSQHGDGGRKWEPRTEDEKRESE